MTETVDPIKALRDTGAVDIAMFLAPARDPGKPWMVYGAGCAINLADFNADAIQEWRNEGVLSSTLATYTPAAPVISDVTATPDAADGTLCSITWTTDIDSDSQVDYGADTSYGSSSVLEPGMVTAHTVALSGLTAGTEYHFIAKSSGTTSADGTFTTAAPA